MQSPPRYFISFFKHFEEFHAGLKWGKRELCSTGRTAEEEEETVTFLYAASDFPSSSSSSSSFLLLFPPPPRLDVNIESLEEKGGRERGGRGAAGQKSKRRKKYLFKQK